MANKELTTEEENQIISNLCKNTEIMEKLFEQCGLSVLSFGYKIEWSSTLFVLGEIISISNNTLTDDYRIKITFYNENGNIVDSHTPRTGCNGIYIRALEFNGLHSFRATFPYAKLFTIHKARIFIVKEPPK